MDTKENMQHNWNILESNQKQITKRRTDTNKLPKINLTQKKEALKDLNLWDDIIITVTKTQKANAIVIIHVEDFINEANL